jgi:chemotaxis protein CheD
MNPSAGANLAAPRSSGAPGEAHTFYYERDFGRNAVKVLPGEFFVAADDIVISTVLGSCVAACIFDRVACIGGMNHFMLPDGGRAGDPAAVAGRFGVFAMEQLINELMKRGARKSNFECKLFGGGAVMKNFTTLNVGERNAQFAIDFLRTEGIRLASQDLLDVYPRRVVFFPSAGRALCRKLAQADDALVADEQRYTRKLNAEPSGGGAIELF